MAGSSASGQKRKRPGDEVEPQATQTGEALCPRCGGSGRSDDGTCPECQGTGRITVTVGDA